VRRRTRSRAHQRDVPQSVQRFLAVVVSPRQFGQVQVARPVRGPVVLVAVLVVLSVVVSAVVLTVLSPVVRVSTPR
jgi:hypothetical protein